MCASLFTIHYPIIFFGQVRIVPIKQSEAHFMTTLRPGFPLYLFYTSRSDIKKDAASIPLAHFFIFFARAKKTEAKENTPFLRNFLASLETTWPTSRHSLVVPESRSLAAVILKKRNSYRME